MKIEFTSLDRLQAFWNALDEVARERKYLLFTKGPDIEGSRAFVSDIIREGETQYFAVLDDKVIGWCDILSSKRAGVSHVGHLGMGVVKSARRKGTGALLLKTSLKDAFSKGITRVELEVFASNTGAVSLYKKEGFREEGRKRKARYIDGTYDDIIVMGLLKEEWLHVK